MKTEMNRPDKGWAGVNADPDDIADDIADAITDDEMEAAR